MLLTLLGQFSKFKVVILHCFNIHHYLLTAKLKLNEKQHKTFPYSVGYTVWYGHDG